jgi:tRNA (guanine37-N1)-methyltransferase
MDIAVVTIFPDFIRSFWAQGVVGRAVDRGIVRPLVVNPRDFTEDVHKTTDDKPYGGGSGMVMKAEPLAGAIRHARRRIPAGPVILLSPKGRRFNQATAQVLSRRAGMILICGRYEGVDHRIRERYIDYEISLGDYVLSGGEVAAMAVSEAVVRLIDGVLGAADAAGNDSFINDRIEHAHFTRPRSFEGVSIPDVLLSGDHAEIARYRKETSLIRTLWDRPDLFGNRSPDPEELDILKRLKQRIEAFIEPQFACRPDPSSRSQ